MRRAVLPHRRTGEPDCIASGDLTNALMGALMAH